MFDTILNWSFRLLLMGVCVLWWHRCYKYNWPKIAAIVATLLMFFAWAIGEGYYLYTGKLPWFFGLEKTFAARDDGGAAFFLILLGIIAWMLTAWLLPKCATRWSNSKWLPGKISPMSLSGIGLVMLLFVSVNVSANICHSYGYTWGLQIVSFGGNICAEASEIGLTENDKMQDDIDQARAKAQRKAPIREHRNTTNGRGR